MKAIDPTGAYLLKRPKISICFTGGILFIEILSQSDKKILSLQSQKM